MSLPRKGLRSVEVDGIAYEWSIRKKPTYSQAALNTSMIVAIQMAEGSGHVFWSQFFR